MAVEYLKIKQMGMLRRSCLKLEGTILVYKNNKWISEYKAMIPVELINISEHSIFYKNLLIVAIIIILLPLFIFSLMWFKGDVDINEYKGYLLLFFVIIIFFGFWVLLALIFNFLFTKKTIRLTIEGQGLKIEFLKKLKYAKEIDLFLEKIHQLQLHIKNSRNLESQPKQILRIQNVNPLKGLFVLCILFCIPALLSQKPVMLCLSLIPIVVYILPLLKSKKHPKEFRQAIKNINHKKWNDAIELLINLHERIPEYLPAIYLLINTYIRTEKFEEALNFIDTVPEKDFKDVNKLRLNICEYKRINTRRFENT